MTIVVVGLGLIGGSLALRLRNIGFSDHIIGVDHSDLNAEVALDLGIVDEVLTMKEAIPMADLIVVAIPVDKIVALMPEVLNLMGDKAVVLDMGSTKEKITLSVDGHQKRGRFVATHPIAGTENSGPEAAFDTLFDDKTGILCDVSESDSDAIQLVKKVYHALGMRIIEMNSQEHDRHIAYVSHLSHISSFVLGQTVLEIEEDEKSIFNMAGSGFASTVRLAKSSPAMWASIFGQNKEYISQSLSVYIGNLMEFKALIDNGETQEMHDSMKKTNEIRRVLDGIDVKNITPKTDQEKVGI